MKRNMYINLILFLCAVVIHAQPISSNLPSDSTVLDRYLKIKSEPAVEECIIQLLDQMGTNREMLQNQEFNTEKRNFLFNQIDKATGQIDSKYYLSCVDTITGKVKDISDPGIQLAAIAKICLEVDEVDLIRKLIPYLSLKLNEQNFHKTNLQILELIQEYEIHNHPIVEMLLKKGEKSVPLLIQHLNELELIELKTDSIDLVYWIKVISVLNELKNIRYWQKIRIKQSWKL